MTPKFRKKPVIIDAVKVSEVIEHAKNSDCVSQEPWIREAIDKQIISIGTSEVFVKTDEGLMRGDYDDMIIRGVKGELYPCKPDVFEKTYESIE